MSKPINKNVKPEVKPVAQPKVEVKPQKQSQFYAIQRYSLHGFQLVKTNKDGSITKIGPENVFGVVSTALSDYILEDLEVGQ